MNETPTQETIERTARTVAAALGDSRDQYGCYYPHNGARPPLLDNAGRVAKTYLSDHRTVARYFSHQSSNPKVSDSREALDHFFGLWDMALGQPMAAIIALVESVGGEGTKPTCGNCGKDVVQDAVGRWTHANGKTYRHPIRVAEDKK